MMGVGQAILGAYVGATLVLLVGGTQLAQDSPVALQPVGWHTVGGLLFGAAIGTLVFVWWIIPLGLLFALVFQRWFETWTKSAATVRGAILGAALGLTTAALLRVVAPQLDAARLRTASEVLTLYGALWCSWHFRRQAGRQLPR
jgi:hypothetical protein